MKRYLISIDELGVARLREVVLIVDRLEEGGLREYRAKSPGRVRKATMDRLRISIMSLFSEERTDDIQNQDARVQPLG